jgi:hypothetical protein
MLPNRAFRWCARALGVVMLVGAAGCGSSDEEPQASFTPGAGAGSPADAEKAKVEADYLAYWDAVLKAQAGPTPEDPELKKHATGQAYRENYTNLSTLRREGWRTKGSYSHRVEVVSIEGETARLQDCADPSKSRLYSVKTGKPVEQAIGKRGKTEYTLRRQNGVWKVAAMTDAGRC